MIIMSRYGTHGQAGGSLIALLLSLMHVPY